MATKKPAKNMVGTPRGYVDKAARDKVDANMQPVAEIGKKLMYLTPGLGAGRLAGAAMKAGSTFARESAPVVAEAVKTWVPAGAVAGAIAGGLDYLEKGASDRANLKTKKPTTKKATDKSRLTNKASKKK